MPFEIGYVKTKNDSQHITIPAKFRIDEATVYIKKVRNVIIIIPGSKLWDSLIDSTHNFSDDFMEKRNQPTGRNKKSNK